MTHEVSAVHLAGGELVEVGSIWAVGRNYPAHALELGNEPPSEPFFFLKARSSLCPSGRTPRPPFDRGVLHHEVELVVLLGAVGEDMDRGAARHAVRAIGVGLDLTLRDLQSRLKAAQLPWAPAKSFRDAAIVSELCTVGPDVDLRELEVWLRVNGRPVQRDRVSSMHFSVDELIAWLSSRVPLAAGDLLYTGTPAGVGPLAPGDRLELGLGEMVGMVVQL